MKYLEGLFYVGLVGGILLIMFWMFQCASGQQQPTTRIEDVTTGTAEPWQSWSSKTYSGTIWNYGSKVKRLTFDDSGDVCYAAIEGNKLVGWSCFAGKTK